LNKTDLQQIALEIKSVFSWSILQWSQKRKKNKQLFYLPFVQQHASDIVEREMTNLDCKIHDFPLLAIIPDRSHHLAKLLSSERTETLQALAGEKFNGANLAQMPPVVAVGRPHDVLDILLEDISSWWQRSSSPHFVLHFEELSCSVGRGHHHDSLTTQFQVHNGTVLLCQVPQADMRLIAKLMHVPNYGQRSRTRR
jgi:hypothetical protein